MRQDLVQKYKVLDLSNAKCRCVGLLIDWEQQTNAAKDSVQDVDSKNRPNQAMLMQNLARKTSTGRAKKLTGSCETVSRPGEIR